MLSLSGVTQIIWLQGEGDLVGGSVAPAAVRDAMAAAVGLMRARIHGVKVIGATLTSTRGSSRSGYGTVDADERRHALNAMIAAPGLFDAVVDFDAATLDPQTGELRAEFLPPSTGGGPGDKVSLNRPGYLAMGDAVELRLLAPPYRPPPKPRPAPKPEDATPPAPAG